MPVSNPAEGYAKASQGNYTGDNTTNRAIPHGLGVTPKFVIFDSSTYDWWRGLQCARGQNAVGGNTSAAPSPAMDTTVTAMDSTNFYVGDGVNHLAAHNASGVVYYWMAVG